MKKYQVKVKFKNYYKSFYVDEYESPYELLKWAEKFGAKKVEFIILKKFKRRTKNGK